MRSPAKLFLLLTVLLLCGHACRAADEPKLLASVPGKKSHLAWSPGGKEIAFLAGTADDTRLMIANVESAQTADLGKATAFDWARDGKTLAVARPDSGPGSVVVRPWPDGTEKRLASGSGPVFSTDGKLVAFMRGGQAFAIPVESGAEQKLVNTSMIDPCLAASPSGFFLTGNGILWSAQAGQAEKLILRNAGMGTDAAGLEYYVGLAVSPDGTKVVIVSSGRQDAGGGLTTLILVNADGSGKKEIGAGQQPGWLPDGKSVVFSAKGDLHIYSLESGTAKPITQKRVANHAWPSCSPDGKTTAFTATLSDTNGDGKIDWRDEPAVFIMKP